MFSLRNFIKNGFLNSVGKLADYKIILNAAGWYDKSVLLEDDLAEIQSAIEARNAALTKRASSGESASVEAAPSGEAAENGNVPETEQAAETEQAPETGQAIGNEETAPV